MGDGTIGQGEVFELIAVADEAAVMSQGRTVEEGHPAIADLTGIPKVEFPVNLQAALAAGNRMTSVMREVVALRRGAGKLNPNEYFYYRLWDPSLSMAEKRRFVGKQAQHPMHMACNHTGWYAAAADKLLFQAVMAGAGLPVPELLAVTRRPGLAGKVPCLAGVAEIEGFLRQPSLYPLFAKPIDGKYSVAVLNADALDPATDRIAVRGQGWRQVSDVAAELAARESGFVLHWRLTAHSGLSRRFGPALWSMRLLVLLTPDEPVVHRAVAKTATGANPADNFWRPQQHARCRGPRHRRDPAVGPRHRRRHGGGRGQSRYGPIHHRTRLPGWADTLELAGTAAQVLPGTRTQSWDVALTDKGPVLLEVNFGRNLNLAQLAHGTGVLDDAYADHLRRCGYRL